MLYTFSFAQFLIASILLCTGVHQSAEFHNRSYTRTELKAILKPIDI